jgi:hypothetical protein
MRRSVVLAASVLAALVMLSGSSAALAADRVVLAENGTATW